MTVVFVSLTSILQVLNEYRSIWGSIDFLSLPDVLSNRKERDRLEVRAVLRSKLNNLRRELGLYCLNRIELVAMVKSYDYQTRIASLVAQTNLSDLS